MPNESSVQEAARKHTALADPGIEWSIIGPGLLSMGMSGDYELAVEEGADVVRVGQAIFGARSTPDSYHWPGGSADAQ
jgi:uncharacterized pyridoxal phosphate-containing UPF0001 family protein